MYVFGFLEPKTTSKSLWMVMVSSIVFSSISIWVAYNVFPAYASILLVVFTVIPFIPLINAVLELQEEGCEWIAVANTKSIVYDSVYPQLDKDKAEVISSYLQKLSFFDRNIDLLKVYAFFFIGILVSFTFWYLILPDAEYNQEGAIIKIPSVEKVFSEQTNVFGFIHGNGSGKVTGSIAGGNTFKNILVNNLGILFLCFLLSLILGSGGALFILSWNASIIATAIGIETNILISGVAYSFVNYGAAIMQVASSLLLHGMPEITAYFTGAIAGGVLAALISRRKRYEWMRYKTVYLSVTKEVLILMIIAVIFVILGAGIESWEIESLPPL